MPTPRIDAAIAKLERDWTTANRHRNVQARATAEGKLHVLRAVATLRDRISAERHAAEHDGTNSADVVPYLCRLEVTLNAFDPT